MTRNYQLETQANVTSNLTKYNWTGQHEFRIITSCKLNWGISKQSNTKGKLCFSKPNSYGPKKMGYKVQASIPDTLDTETIAVQF
jgi:hypothetical protein